MARNGHGRHDRRGRGLEVQRSPCPRLLQGCIKTLPGGLSCWSIWWSPSPYGFLFQRSGSPRAGWLLENLKIEWIIDLGVPPWLGSLGRPPYQSRSRSMWQKPQGIGFQSSLGSWDIHLCCFLHWGSAPWTTTTTTTVFVSMFRWIAVAYRIGILTTDWGPGFLSP